MNLYPLGFSLDENFCYYIIHFCLSESIFISYLFLIVFLGIKILDCLIFLLHIGYITPLSFAFYFIVGHYMLLKNICSLFFPDVFTTFFMSLLFLSFLMCLDMSSSYLS